MKILVICGLTASGKTSLALKIAQKLGNTTLISADSRQAYRALPVLTGQDIPKDFTRHQDKSCSYQDFPGVYFSKGSINIYGVDQVPADQTLNIANFTKFVWQVIKKETQRGKKIIIVGGTGLYLKALTQPMLDIHLGFDENLRDDLSKLSLEKLQEKLKVLDAKKLETLNQSDRSNPRRLIRAIEILLSPTAKKPSYFKLQKGASFRWVGLRPDLKTLEKNINQRVLERLKNKVVDEVGQLQDVQKNDKAPIFSALGLVPILKYKNKEIDKKDLMNLWAKADLKLAKRQLTWFKKQSSIIWYDQDSDQTKLIKTLSSWLAK